MIRAVALAALLVAACSFDTLPALVDARDPDAVAPDGPDVDAAVDAPGDAGDATDPDAPTDAPIDGPPIDGPPIDAPTDAMTDAPIDAAPGPVVLASTIPLRFGVGETGAITFTIMARPSTVLTWYTSSGGGGFAPAGGSASTNSSGIGTITVNYTAPADAGDLAHTLSVVDGGNNTNAPFETKVRVLRRFGEVAPFPDNQGLAIAANSLGGQTVFIDRDTVIMRLGVIAHSGGYNGRLALYANGASAPTTLLAATNLATITAVAQELPVTTPRAVTTGTYWIAGNFDAAAAIKRSPTSVTLAFATLATTAALPNPFASPTILTNRALNYYVVVAD